MLNPSSLDMLYEAYDAPEWIPPDPLEVLSAYPDPRDREVVGLIASSLAYGRVRQILQSVRWILKRIGRSPYDFLSRATPQELSLLSAGFRHRFTGEDDLRDLLEGIRSVLRLYGSIQECFLSCFRPRDTNTLPALSGLVRALDGTSNGRPNSLLPLPEKGSACKRLHLYLRWMVRKDRVDPGGWSEIPASKLIVPLDTHMHRIGVTFGFTRRKAADLRTAMEITEGFRRIRPEDPVRYDFALTRLGIRKGPAVSGLWRLFAGEPPDKGNVVICEERG